MNKDTKAAWIFMLILSVISIVSHNIKNSESETHRAQLSELGYDTLSPSEASDMNKNCKTKKLIEFCKKNKLGEYRL